MVTTVVMAVLLVSSAAAAREAKLGLELAPTVSTKVTGAVQLTFRTRGSGDVYFNRAAVRLTVASTSGEAVPSGCETKRSPPQFVRLRSGQTISETIGTGCYHLKPGVSYGVTAELDDTAAPFHEELPASMTWAIGPIRSNKIVVRLGSPSSAAAR